jgi:hypothetical protein
MTAIARNTQVQDIPPEIAWEAWTPSADEPWDFARVSLLIRRAGFGARSNDLDLARKLSPLELFDSLIQSEDASKSDAFENESATILKGVLASGSVSKLAAWWLHRLLHSPAPLREKVVLFWHGHFATGAEKVVDAELMWQQNSLLRIHALGGFRDLVQSESARERKLCSRAHGTVLLG